MYTGEKNTSGSGPLEKMRIININRGETMFVLYNPESYTQSRKIGMSMQPAVSTNQPAMQFAWGTSETLSFTLFFDSMSAGSEIGGSVKDKDKFEKNRTKISAEKSIDIREYTKKIYNLMRIDPSLHAPPLLKLEWASLQFTGYMTGCTQEFIKFNEKGMPVRAKLQCAFQEYVEPQKISTLTPYESPDTTKYRTVVQGDSLWALSAKEYGQPEQWREIATANGLANPRRLRTGERIVLPGLD